MIISTNRSTNDHTSSSVSCASIPLSKSLRHTNNEVSLPCPAYHKFEESSTTSTQQRAIETRPQQALTRRPRGGNDAAFGLLTPVRPEALDFDTTPTLLDDGATTTATPTSTSVSTDYSAGAAAGSSSRCIGEFAAPESPVASASSSTRCKSSILSAATTSPSTVMEHPDSPESSSMDSIAFKESPKQPIIENTLTSAVHVMIHPDCSSSANNINTTSPPTSSASRTLPARPLVSALRRRSAADVMLIRSPILKARPSTGRRVRGLWSPVVMARDNDSDLDTTTIPSVIPKVHRNMLDGLQDTTLEHVFSFLSMADWLKCTMVDRRCSYIAQRDTIWKRVDATDFCQQAHATFSKKLSPPKATRATCEALDQVLQKYVFSSSPTSPSVTTSLTIRCIGKYLSAEWFLPGASGLQELTLTGFDDLTDTHVHVMLLAAGYHGVARKSNTGNALRKLVLEDCPLLTNAVVRSIATRCTNLEVLSLKGSGNRSGTAAAAAAAVSQLTDVTPLAALLVTSPATFALAVPDIMNDNTTTNNKSSLGKRPSGPASSSSGSPALSGLSLNSLFAPAPATKPHPKPNPSTNALASLFGPPPAKNATASSNAPSPPLATKSQPQHHKPAGNALASLFGPPQSKVAAAPSDAPSPPLATTTSQPQHHKPAAGALASLFGPPPAKVAAAPSNSPSPPSVTTKLQPQHHKPAATTNSLNSLFGGPPPKSSTKSLLSPAIQRPPQQQTPGNSLTSLFGPPPPKSSTKSLQSSPPVQQQQQQHQPPTHQQEQPANGLASLFAIPGTSPKGGTTKPPVSFAAMHAPPKGKLVRIDLRGTSVSAQAFTACLQQASTAASHHQNNSHHLVHLESLGMDGSTWTDASLRQLANLVALDDLQELDLEVSSALTATNSSNTLGSWGRSSTPTTKLTHAGLRGLAASDATTKESSTACLSKLRRLNLTGHSQITEAGAAASLIKAAPRLDTILL